MAFQLTIEMVGLCLFVPDPTAGVVYIPMPSSEQGHGVDPHAVRLVFDSAYLCQESTELLGFPSLVSLDRTELELHIPDASFDPTIPDGVANVSEALNLTVLPEALAGDDPDMLLAARLVLRSGAAASTAAGACWNWPAAVLRRHMSNRVYWTVGDVAADELNLTLTALAGGTGGTLTLYPIEEEIHLQLYYTPRDELPPQPWDPGPPPVGTPAHHFGAFYTLFEGASNNPLPLYFGLTCVPHMEGGSPYTCMAAQGSPSSSP